jgi:hypothetical protein
VAAHSFLESLDGGTIESLALSVLLLRGGRPTGAEQKEDERQT